MQLRLHPAGINIVWEMAFKNLAEADEQLV